jgi:hypothetical protein
MECRYCNDTQVLTGGNGAAQRRGSMQRQRQQVRGAAGRGRQTGCEQRLYERQQQKQEYQFRAVARFRGARCKEERADEYWRPTPVPDLAERYAFMRSARAKCLRAANQNTM